MKKYLPTVAVFLNKRKLYTKGVFPVQLRVYDPKTQKRKYYGTNYQFSSEEFDSIWNTIKPRRSHQNVRIALQRIELEANNCIEQLDEFSFHAFEDALFGISEVAEDSVVALFEEVMQSKQAISTSEKYRYSLKHLVDFLKRQGKDSQSFGFTDLTEHFLLELRQYFEYDLKHSKANIGINLRNIRAVYNVAIKRGIVSQESYPFGQGKLRIPRSEKVNKALTEEELKQLWNHEPETDSQAFAKDFWFFSYYAYGMNPKDICELTPKSIRRGEIFFTRAKTRTTKAIAKETAVPITESLQEIINRRRVKGAKYLFGFLEDGLTREQEHTRVRNFNSVVNKQFRKFAISAGIDPDFANEIGMYHARHSFATVAVSKGKSVALISEILHDGNIAVTTAYINSFPKSKFRELSMDMEL